MQRALLTIAAGLVELAALYHFWQQHKTAAGFDFYIYYVASQLAGRADVDNIYSAETQERVGDEFYERAVRSGSPIRKYDATRRRRLDNVSSPFLYASLRWLSRDYDRALLQYKIVVLIAFIVGVLLTCRRAGMQWWTTLLLLGLLLYLYRGIEADLRVGNVNSLQFLALAVALWCPPILAGAIMGMLICFKPNLILVAMLLAVSHARDKRRLIRETIGGAIGGLAAFTIAAISYGPRSWIQWVTAANEFWHRLPTRIERNCTPLLEVYHAYGEWIGYVLAALLALAVCVVLWRTKKEDDLLVIGLGCLIYLMTGTVVWLHYMVLAVPAAVALMRHRVTAALTIVALLLMGEILYEKITDVAVYPHDALWIGPGLVILFACGLWMLNRRPVAAA